MAERVEWSRPRRHGARPAWLAVLCLLLSAAAACRTDPAIVLLEQENRQLEDMIFRQQDAIERYQRALNAGSTECGVPEDRAQPAQSDSFLSPSLSPPEVVGPALPGTSPSTTVERSRQRAPTASPGDTPPGGDRSRARPTPSDQRGTDAPRVKSAPGGKGPTDPAGAAPQTRTDNTRVSQITLRQLPGRAGTLNRRPGDEGLNLLVEPRDADGRLVVAAAPVSVVVLDPALTGEAARVARWDFAAEEIAGRFATTTGGQGILLETVWPAGPPIHNRLHLFVRYTTNDGRKVEAEKVIDVAVAQAEGGSWQPALAKAAAPAPAATRTTTDRQQRRATPQTEPSPAEPLRTASLAAQPPSRAGPAANLRPPVWSPDRP